MTLMRPKVCRYCGCTEEDACTLPTGDPCSWYEATRTVCTNPGCVRKFEAVKAENRAKAAREKAERRMSSADVHDAIRRGNKPKKKVAR